MSFLNAFKEGVIIGVLVDASKVEGVRGQRRRSSLLVGMVLQDLFTICKKMIQRTRTNSSQYTYEQF